MVVFLVMFSMEIGTSQKSNMKMQIYLFCYKSIFNMGATGLILLFIRRILKILK